MGNQEFEELGDKIQDIIEQAIDSKNYQQLNQSINQTVNRAIDNGSEALKNVLNNAFHPEHNARAYETHKNHGYQQPPFGKQQKLEPKKEENTSLSLYKKTTGTRAKGVLMTVFGGILTGGMGLGLVVALLSAGFGFVSSAWYGTTAFIAAGTAAGAVLLAKGCGSLGKLGRFRKYMQALGHNTYCNFEMLSRAVGKPVKYVKKDIKSMIHKGWFLEGHVDKQETCLITSNETYRQYVQTQEQLEQKQKEEEAAASRAKQEHSVSAEVQEVLDKGDEYLIEIRRCNDAIPGEEISAKISRIELIVQKIFERAEEHPEIIPDLKRFMDYYLPMTVKLLNAYEDMDSQPVQGENILNSKKEIEDTLDTLNVAFEKLLDSIFEDTALDVSSDISVLHTILAQEGLTEDDFAKMQRETRERMQ